MSEPFTIPRAHVAAVDWYTLKRELFRQTGSEHEASSILRGLERIGSSDPSIGHYEMTPSANPRRYPGAPSVVWSVQAVRS